MMMWRNENSDGRKTWPGQSGVLWLYVRRLLLVMAALMMFQGAITPKTLYAVEDGDVIDTASETGFNVANFLKEVGEWGKKHQALFTMIKWITDIWNLLIDKTDALEKAWGGSGKVQLLAEETKMRAAAKMADAVIDARLHDAVLGPKLLHTGQNALPPASEQFLCNLILARQIVPVLTEFAQIGSYALGREMNEWYRCSDCDGNGPQFVSDAWAGKCGTPGKNWPKTGTLRSGDPKECREPGNGSDTDYADMDLNADTLSLDKVFTVPLRKDVETMIDGKKTTVKDYVPDEGDEAQRQWIAAKRFCYNVAGPRLSPPFGKDIDTPEGKTRYARFATCLAKQNDFLRSCRDRLWRLTRPNCSGADWGKYCEASALACAAAQDAAITLPPEFQCAEGLSLQQAEFLSNELCGTNRAMQASGHAGANDARRHSMLVKCGVIKGAWERRMAKEDREFLASVLDLQSMKDCWAFSGKNR